MRYNHRSDAAMIADANRRETERNRKEKKIAKLKEQAESLGFSLTRKCYSCGQPVAE